MQAIDTRTIQHQGRQFEVSRYADDSHGAPWDEECGHGSVRFIAHSSEIRRGEMVLHDSRHGRYLYDFGAALLTASRDGWGLGPDDLQRLTQRLGKKPTRGQIRAESVRNDMEYLRGWCADEWGYIGVCVRIIGPDGEPIGDEFDNALWGVESCGDYWQEVARELADDILYDRGKDWRAALKEARARRYWASRDVMTVGA